MAIIILPYQQKQKKLIILFVLILFLIAVILFFGVGPGQKLVGSLFGVNPVATTTPEGSSIKDVDIDFFDNSRYQALKPFANDLIEPKKIGRKNPFEPY